MHRYFGSLENGLVRLSELDTHHLVDVVRVLPNEKIEVVIDEKPYSCLVKSLKPLQIEPFSLLEEKRELDNQVTLAFAVLKGSHNDLVVEKGTELGASCFLPFVSDRSVVKPILHETDGRLQRLSRIAKEASQQCRRNTIPEVKDYSSISEVLSYKADIKIFCYEGYAGSSTTLISLLQNLKKGVSVLAVVGPEGGFTDDEAQKAKESGFSFVSLGRRILRGETASIDCLALIAAYSEKED